MADADTFDAQDNAEAFDEDNTEGDDQGLDLQDGNTLEELPDLLDLTTRLGDGSADGQAVDEDEFTDDLIEDEDLEDPLAARGGDQDPEEPEPDAAASDEVELEFVADVEGRRGAQGSAAHLESRAELSDADLAELGYRDGDKGD